MPRFVDCFFELDSNEKTSSFGPESLIWGIILTEAYSMQS